MSCLATSPSSAGALLARCRRSVRSLQTRLATLIVRLWELLRRGQCLLFSYLDSFWIMLLYFLCSSVVGFAALTILGHKPGAPRPTRFDLFFTSVSAATVSSMSTVSMEDLSRGQLVVVALLMMIGGEVFSSVVQLHMLKSTATACRCRGDVVVIDKNNDNGKGPSSEGNKEMEVTRKVADAKLDVREVELVEVVVVPVGVDPTVAKVGGMSAAVEIHFDNDNKNNKAGEGLGEDGLRLRSINLLTMVIALYMGLAHLLGFIATLSYMALAGDARAVLRERQIPLTLFSSFVVASSFSSGGFIPTKEGMAPFKSNSGLLALLMPLLLAGNTMFPAALRAVLWALRRLGGKSRHLPELEYLASDRSQELRFHHLPPKRHVVFLAYTVWALLVLQFMLFCGLEWNSTILEGMNANQKIVAALFQSVNSRHAGESLFDISVLSTAVVVTYLAMMYLPSYTMFLPEVDGTGKTKKEGEEDGPTKLGLRKSLVMSHLAYLVAFVVIVSLTERRRLSEDPLNFNLLSIAVEVVSAYGNVGFSTGYSCARQMLPGGGCEVSWYGFVGKWSTKGKLVLVIVMFFGRLKKFNMKGGRAWKLQ